MRAKGMTLIELTVALAMTGVVLMATGRVMMSSQQAIRVAAIETDLSQQAMIACERIADDLKDAVSNTIQVTSVDGVASCIVFRKCIGYAPDQNGILARKLSNLIKYELASDVRRGQSIWIIRRTETDDATGREDVADLCDAATHIGLHFYESPSRVWEISVQVMRQVLDDGDNDSDGTGSSAISDLWSYQENNLNYFLLQRTTKVHVNF